MNGFAVIQQQLLLSFFLVAFSWLKWRTRVLRTIAVGRAFGSGIDILRPPLLLLSAFHSQQQKAPLLPDNLPSSTGIGRSSTKSRPSISADWIAPVIVWFLLIMMAFAIVGFLLGER